ncbi:MAG: hypothetical protein H6908_02255 [Hyphomicrobiales bacterium]|nr:hypothetical protein [Hyphomicrobiales bacterium]
MSALKNRKGENIQLGRLLGKGGEGAVYEVPGASSLVAKIYHQPLAPEKAGKLHAMSDMKTDRLLSLTAWPVDVLNGPDGKPKGFLMPQVTGHKDIHALYTPKSRKDSFPEADWRFLVHTAANVARAFAMIHDHGCVIGDVNHGSVLVSAKATVRLIDCDSFQINTPKQQFLCTVGVPTYTPAELQGKSFKGVVRSANHDAFGLAIMLFHLLFMGRHPFAGRFLGKGDMPIERAISEHRFAFSSYAKQALMEPPPHTLQLNAISPQVSLLFERAFSREGIRDNGRPTAREWVTALEGLEKQIKKCGTNASHYHFSNLTACPWCKIEAATGVILFSLFIQHGPQSSTYNMAVIWKKITDVTPPPPPPELPNGNAYKIQPSTDAQAIAGKRKNNKVIGYLAIGGAILAALAGAAPGAASFWLIAGAVVLHYVLSNSKGDTGKFSTAYYEANNAWNATVDRWQREAGNKRFHEKLDQLRKVKAEWEGLPTTRQKRYQQLQNERQQAQLKRFLESHLIDRAKIKDVGSSRKAMLESYNIETAWDITERAVRRVPGFGDALTKRLLEWRRSIERKFVFNASQGVDPRDIAALDRELADTKRKLEAQLLAGAPELIQIRTQITTSRGALQKEVERAYVRLLQAEADKKAVGI